MACFPFRNREGGWDILAICFVGDVVFTTNVHTYLGSNSIIDPYRLEVGGVLFVVPRL